MNANDSTSLKTASLREDLTPFLRNEIERCFGSNPLGAGNLLAPDLPRAILIDAWHLGASDIHFEPSSQGGGRVRLRIDGVIWNVMQLTREQAKIFINQFKGMAGIDPVVRFTPSDAGAIFKMVDGQMNLRLSLAPSATGETLAIRVLDSKRLDRSIIDLGLRQEDLEQLSDWERQTSSMFLASGPTGAGKTTTAYSLLQGLKSGNRIVISLEDPVEYQVDGVVQIQINELQNMTFAEGAKAMLRHDPDVLMLGEIRDAVSAHTAVQAAIAGRMLISTIHSRDAIGAVTTLRNWGLSDREIADALTVVVSQRLVRKLCESCRETRLLSKRDEAWFGTCGLKVPDKIWNFVGCKDCNHLGYRGRVGLFEVWRVGEHDYQSILSGSDELSMRRQLGRRKHRFLLEDALDKLKAGHTSLDEVRRIAGGILPVVSHPRAKKSKVKAAGASSTVDGSARANPEVSAVSMGDHFSGEMDRPTAPK